MSWRGLLALLVSVGAVTFGAAGGCGLQLEMPGTGGSGGSTSTIFASSSSSGAGTSSGGGAGGASGGLGIAAACLTDADCRSGLVCLLDTVNDPIFGGGPADGFCTSPCDEDTDCGEPDAVCLKIDPTQPGRCTLSCTLGPSITSADGFFDPLLEGKCQGREDVRCGKAKNGVGVCLPTCGEDTQCTGGRVCDPRLAVCVDHPNDGLPTGASCTPGIDPSPCGGLCVGFDSGIGMCSSPCVLGGEKDSSSDCGGPERGFCFFRPQTNGVGDVGFCSPSCASQADCASPNFWCFTVPELGRGYCFTATPCPNGPSDCHAGTACTDTPGGPLCLDPQYPLGGGGAGGGMP